MTAAVGGREVIMGMYQEMVVSREQGETFVAVVVGEIGQTKQGQIQVALNDSELGARE